MGFQVKSHVDFNKYQAQSLSLEVVANSAGVSSPVKGQIIYDDAADIAKFYDGTVWKSMLGGAQFTYSVVKVGSDSVPAISTTDVLEFITGHGGLSLELDDDTPGEVYITYSLVPSNIDHNSLANLTSGDVHTQYVHLSNARTITAQHTFQPGSAATAPFLVGTNGTGLVTRLNADKLDGYDASTSWSATEHIPVTNSSGKILSGYLTEVLAIADLSDVASKTGTGTAVVMSGNPTLAGITLTADVAMGGYKITNLGTPSIDTDGATKGYVDQRTMGLSYKEPVRAATTTNVNLTGGAPDTLDGVTLALNDRILVKNQTTGSQNGIYIIQTLGSGSNGTWVRASDADSSTELTSSTYVMVQEGSIYDNTGWTLSNNGTITIGTTSLVWVQVTGAGAYTSTNVNSAGIGVYEGVSGNQFQFRGIDAGSNRISVSENGTNKTIEINAVEANFTLNNIGGTLSIAKGGTGATDAATARSNLGLGTVSTMSKYTANVGNGSNTSITVTHSLGTKDVLVSIYDNSTDDQILVEWEHASTSAITLKFVDAPATDAYRVVVIG